jgi:hypothetical protein
MFLPLSPQDLNEGHMSFVVRTGMTGAATVAVLGDEQQQPAVVWAAASGHSTETCTVQALMGMYEEHSHPLTQPH